MKIFIDFLKFLLPVIVAVITWYLNESRKRSFEEYQRKEESYRELVKAAKGFYDSHNDRNLKQQFLDQLDLCWLYSPDEVILKAYSFLSTVHRESLSRNIEPEMALGELMVSIRKDLLSRKIVRKTKLGPRDFKLLSPS